VYSAKHKPINVTHTEAEAKPQRALEFQLPDQQTIYTDGQAVKSWQK